MKVHSKILSNVGVLDMFGVKPSLKIQGEPKSYSLIGLILTTVVAGFMVWAAIFTGRELFEKKNPTLTVTSLPGTTLNETFILSPETFDFAAFGLFDLVNNRLYINTSIYRVYAYIQMDSTNVSNFLPLELEPCQKRDYITPYDYVNKSYCFKKHQPNIDKIIFKTTERLYVNIKFARCNTSDPTAGCMNDAEISRRIASSYFVRGVSQYVVDPTDYKKPLKPYYKEDFTALSYSLMKLAHFYVSQIEFETDDGFLLESQNPPTTALTFEKLELDVSDPRGDLVFLNIFISNSGTKHVYFRRYSKLQDALAQVSGLVGGFIFIIGIFVLPYAEIKMNEKLINNIYDINFTKNPPGKSDFTTNSDLRTEDIKLDNDISVIRPLESSSSPWKGVLDDEIPSTNPPLEISVIEESEVKTVKNCPAPRLDSPDLSHFRPNKFSFSQPEEVSLDTVKTEKLEISLVEMKSVAVNEDTVPNSVNAPDKNDTLKSTSQNRKEVCRTVSFEENAQHRGDLSNGVKGWFKKKKRKDLSEKKENLKPGLHIGYFEWLLSFFKTQPRMRMYNEGVDNMMKRADFQNLLYKLSEVDKIKMCIMNSEQRILFDNLQRCQLRLNFSENTKNATTVDVFDWSDNYQNDDQRAKNAYKHIKSLRTKTNIDKNLLLLYETKMRSII